MVIFHSYVSHYVKIATQPNGFACLLQLPQYLSVCLSIYPSINPSVHPSIYLSICLIVQRHSREICANVTWKQINRIQAWWFPSFHATVEICHQKIQYTALLPIDSRSAGYPEESKDVPKTKGTQLMQVNGRSICICKTCDVSSDNQTWWRIDHLKAINL